MSPSRTTSPWAEISAQFDAPTFGSAVRSAVGKWLVDVLEHRLGTEWPLRAADARALRGLGDMASSNEAFFDWLLLALRLETIKDVPGRRPVLHSLGFDLQHGVRRHVDVQLEVACLALSQGWDARFEERRSRERPPLDVVLRKDGQILPIEVRVVLTSDHNADVLRESRAIDPIVFELLARYEVVLGGNLPGIPSESGRLRLWQAVEPMAIQVSQDHQSRQVIWNGATLVLAWIGAGTQDLALNMPIPLQGDSDRLARTIATKELQASKSGARWLRLDLLGGYFQLSPWWDQPFMMQLGAFVDDVRSAAGSNFDGVVVSSALQIGSRDPQTAHHDSGAIGLIRQASPIGSRTTAVIPLNPAGDALTADLADLYDSEPKWVDAALARCGQPHLTQIMAMDP